MTDPNNAVVFLNAHIRVKYQSLRICSNSTCCVLRVFSGAYIRYRSCVSPSGMIICYQAVDRILQEVYNLKKLCAIDYRAIYYKCLSLWMLAFCCIISVFAVCCLYAFRCVTRTGMKYAAVFETAKRCGMVQIQKKWLGRHKERNDGSEFGR